MRLETCLKPRNFYDFYMWNISVKLQKIDLLLKTSWRGISLSSAARALDVSSEEISRIMRDESIKRIDRDNFYRVMRRGSSGICRYVRREDELCRPLTYTLEEIAYIYDLNIEDVNRASEITGITEATALTLPCLFYHIPAE